MEAIVLGVLVVMASMVLAYGWWLATKEITNEELREIKL